MIKQREGDPKFPCWKWFWSLWTLWTRTVRVKEKRDPKSKQSKAKRDILKMRRVESLLVVFLFCFCRTVKLWVKRHFKRESTQAIFMLRKKRSQAPRKYELSLQLWLLPLKTFTTWVPSHSRELGNVSNHWKAPCPDWMCGW